MSIRMICFSHFSLIWICLISCHTAAINLTTSSECAVSLPLLSDSLPFTYPPHRGWVIDQSDDQSVCSAHLAAPPLLRWQVVVAVSLLLPADSDRQSINIS